MTVLPKEKNLEVGAHSTAILLLSLSELLISSLTFYFAYIITHININSVSLTQVLPIWMKKIK